MPIVSSSVIEDRVQIDGRRAIREQHTDQLGKVYFFYYLAEANTDTSSVLTSRVATLETSLTNSEIDLNESNAFDQVAPIFNYSTAVQLRTRLRARFQIASSWDAVRLGKFINSLGLTDNQLMTLFGVSGVQLTALKAKLVSLAAKYDDVISQQGQ